MRIFRLRSDSEIRSYSSSFAIDTKNNDLILVTYLCVGKYFIFMCILLMHLHKILVGYILFLYFYQSLYN